MKTQYIQPSTKYQPMNFVRAICVGSVHGNAPLRFGGGSDGTGANAPM